MRHDPQARAALLLILRRLATDGYHFITPTPATHARILSRPDRRRATTLRDIFGWSLPFAAGDLPAALRDALETAGALRQVDGLFASTLRVSTVAGTLFFHSAYPTDQAHAVFLGPDSYRFADFVTARLGGLDGATRIIDIGTGAGVGAVTAGRALPGTAPMMTDINADALFLAEINAAHADLTVTAVHTSALDGLSGPFDLIVANPPFVMDHGRRAYRDGGGMHGARISLDWAAAAARRLASGGRLLLYTGSAIVAGEDGLRHALAANLAGFGCTMDYRELDPDIFGEELDQPLYRDVERIAAVGIVLTRAA